MALIEGLPRGARQDAGVLFSRIQVLRRADKIAEAAAMVLAAPRDPAEIDDPDAWWVERRLIARKLLDLGNAVCRLSGRRDAAPPDKENYRAEHDFTAGWIALRFLKDPAIAAQHFARIGSGVYNPITLARAGYWRGRAAEAMNKIRRRAPITNRPRITDRLLRPAGAGEGSGSRSRVASPPDPAPDRRSSSSRAYSRSCTPSTTAISSSPWRPISATRRPISARW